MKTILNYINESKNPVKGGVKVGDKLWVLCNRNNYKNPIEITIKSVIPIPGDEDEYKLEFDHNEADIKSFSVYTGDIDYSELDYGYCLYFTGDSRKGYVIFGKSIEDLKDSLESRYGEQIKSLTKEINDKQEEINNLQVKLDKLLDKINI